MLYDNDIKSKDLEEYEQRKSKERELYELRRIYVLCFIENKGINLKEFFNSNFYKSENRKYLIENIYGKLNGYDFTYNVYSKIINGISCYEIGKMQKDNSHKLDLDKVNVTLDNNILVISDSNVSYKYEVNEDGSILINGECLLFQMDVFINDKIRKYMKRIYNEFQSMSEKDAKTKIKAL